MSNGDWVGDFFCQRDVAKGAAWKDPYLVTDRAIKMKYPQTNDLQVLAERDAKFVGCHTWIFPDDYEFPPAIDRIIRRGTA